MSLTLSPFAFEIHVVFRQHCCRLLMKSMYFIDSVALYLWALRISFASLPFTWSLRITYVLLSCGNTWISYPLLSFTYEIDKFRAHCFRLLKKFMYFLYVATVYLWNSRIASTSAAVCLCNSPMSTSIGCAQNLGICSSNRFPDWQQCAETL